MSPSFSTSSVSRPGLLAHLAPRGLGGRLARRPGGPWAARGSRRARGPRPRTAGPRIRRTTTPPAENSRIIAVAHQRHEAHRGHRLLARRRGSAPAARGARARPGRRAPRPGASCSISAGGGSPSAGGGDRDAAEGRAIGRALASRRPRAPRRCRSRARRALGGARRPRLAKRSIVTTSRAEPRQHGRRRSPSRCPPRAPSRRRAARAAAPCRPRSRAGRSSAPRRCAARRRGRRGGAGSSGTKRLARHLGHRRQHALVVDPAPAQLALHHARRACQWM